MAISGSATASSPAARRSSTQRAASRAGRVTITRAAAISDARRPRAASCAASSPSAPAWPRNRRPRPTACTRTSGVRPSGSPQAASMRRRAVGLPSRVGRQRHRAAAAHRAADRALGGGGEPVAAARQRRQQLDQVGAIGAHLDAERTLPGGRQHRCRARRSRGCGFRGPAASGRPRPARSRRTGLRRACAAGCRDCRARARCAGRAAARAAAPRGAGWRCRPPRPAASSSSDAWRGDTSASRGILALQHAGQREAFGQVHRHVLERMHRDVGAPFFEREFEFLDEQALAADLAERAVEDLVAAGGHAEQCDGVASVLAAAP